MSNESSRSKEGSGFAFLGMCILVALVASSAIISYGALRIAKFSREVITVTGAAIQEIKSNYIVWGCDLSSRSMDLQSAYASLQTNREKVKAYLLEKGVAEAEISFNPVYTYVLYRRGPEQQETNEVEGYRLNQTVEVRSAEVDKIAQMAKQSSELINQGIEFQAREPQYFYTKLEDLKVEMLGKATENAKERATRMAQATGDQIGAIRSARMGVFQITPLYSTEVSDYGMNDTSSLEKKITAVVNVTFEVK